MRKKLLIAVIFIAACATYLSAYEKPAKKPVVVAFGDSLVEGVGSAQGGGFVSMLSAKAGVPIKNLGIRGNTTADALSRVNEVIKEKPRIVLVLLGGNDYLQGVPRSETEANLSKIISVLQTAGAKVLLIGLSSPLPDNQDRAFFDALARKYKVDYVPDVLKGISGTPSLMSDDLHPNDQGYALMAERIYPEFEKLLR